MQDPLSSVTPPAYDLDRRHLQQVLLHNPLAGQIQLARGFHDRYPDDAFANHLVAALLGQTRDKIKAIPFAQRAVQRGNFALDYVVLLFRLYIDFHFHEQIAQLLKALPSLPQNSAQFEMLLGKYSLDIGKLEDCVRHLRAAIELFVTESDREQARWLLVSAYRNSNQKDEAKALLDSFKAHPAMRQPALLERAELASSDELQSISAEIEHELGNQEANLTDSDKERLFLALGKLQEKEGKYDDAFGSWERSRALVKAGYNSRIVEAFVKDNRAFFNTELFQKTLPFASTSSAPLFVVGMPRSGTTLVAQILSAHADVASAGELFRLMSEAHAFMATYNVPKGQRSWIEVAAKGEIANRARDYLNLLQLTSGRTAKHYIDKTPDQSWHSGYLHMLFPKARMLNVLRHPADVFVSTYQNSFNHSASYAFDQRTFAHYYVQHSKMMSYWRKLLSSSMLDISYEELVASPEHQVRRILSFLELGWDPVCLRFFERPSMVHTFSRDQVRSAINSKSVGRWRNYEKHLGPLFETLSDLGFSYPEANTMNSTPQQAYNENI